MVNVGLGWSSFVGITLAAAGLALYFLRSLRPKLARDHDIVFAAIALLCGGILFFQGWRQDPILQFGQFLLTGTAIFFAVESVRLRGATAAQARQNSPIVDEESPVKRRFWDAKLDDRDYLDPRSTTPRIRGSRDPRSERDEYEERPRRSSPPRASLEDSYGNGDRPRRRPRSDEDFGQDSAQDDVSPRRRSSRGTSPARSGNQPPTSKPRRPRPDDDVVRSRERRSTLEDTPSEYVDYRPVDNDNETDNWGDE